MDARTVLLALCLKYDNDWNNIYRAVKRAEMPTDIDFLRAETFHGNFICITDHEYPELLRQKIKPPFVLYYDGDLSLLSGVDEGKYVFLHGPNLFNIPEDRLCVITDDNRLRIGGRLTVWFNDSSDNVDRFGVAAGLCKTIVGTKTYNSHNWSWFCMITCLNAVELGSRIFIVPGDPGTWNHDMIETCAVALTPETASEI